MKRGLIGVLVAEAISQIGTKMSFVAIPWLVLVTTDSPTMMGIVAAAEMLPYVLVGVFGAPLIDRLGTWRAAVDTDMLSAVIFAVLVFTYDRLGIGALIALVAVAGALRGLNHPARAVLLRPMIDQAGANVTRITTTYDGIGRLTTLIGAPVAGMILVWFDATTVIAIDAATFAASALLMSAFVKAPQVVPKERESYLDSLKGGMQYLRRDQLVMGILVLLFITNLAAQAHQVIFIPLWVMERLGTPAGLGMVFGAFALGAVLGNIGFTAIGPRLPRYLTLSIAYMAGGVPRLLILALTDNLFVAMTVLFFSGVALAAINPIIGAVLYQRVPPEMQARVFGISSAFASAGLPLGSLLGGWVAQSVGLTTGLWIGSAVVFLATLIPFIDAKTWRQLDDHVKSLLISLRYHGGRWRLEARQGATTLVQRDLTAAEALRKVSMLDVPAALEAVDGIAAEEHQLAVQRAERLRAELAEAEQTASELGQARSIHSTGMAAAIAS